MPNAERGRVFSRGIDGNDQEARLVQGGDGGAGIVGNFDLARSVARSPQRSGGKDAAIGGERDLCAKGAAESKDIGPVRKSLNARTVTHERQQVATETRNPLGAIDVAEKREGGRLRPTDDAAIHIKDIVERRRPDADCTGAGIYRDCVPPDASVRTDLDRQIVAAGEADLRAPGKRALKHGTRCL